MILSFIFSFLLQTTFLNAEEAAKKLGEQVTVKDKVSGSRLFEREGSRTLLINLAKPYPNSPLTIVLKNAVLEEVNPKDLDGKTIVASGKITIFREKAQIEIEKAEDFKVE